MVNGGKSYAAHVPLTLDVTAQWREKYMTVTGTLVHSYFLLPNLWVCKPCTIWRKLHLNLYMKKILLRMLLIYVLGNFSK